MRFEDLKLDVVSLCRKYGVKRLEVFGSFARGDAKDGSDIDLIMDIDDGPGMVDRYLGIINELNETTHRRVDVLPNRKYKNPVFSRNVDKDRRLVYG